MPSTSHMCLNLVISSSHLPGSCLSGSFSDTLPPQKTPSQQHLPPGLRPGDDTDGTTITVARSSSPEFIGKTGFVDCSQEMAWLMLKDLKERNLISISEKTIMVFGIR